MLPLLNGPSDRRPPGIYGHFLCALTCSPNKWPLTGSHPRDAASSQQICAEKPLVTSDGRPVHVANVWVNNRPAFMFNVGIGVLVYTSI